MKLREILEQPNGFAPPVIDFKIKKVYERRAGVGKHGNWSFQNIDISDESGNARLSLNSLPELTADHVGKMCRISCKSTPKYGLTGLKVEHKETNGKKYSAIVVTASALWTWFDANAKQQEQEQEPQAQPQEAQAKQFLDNEAAAIQHLKACQQLAIELALMAKNAGAPSESIITGNQVVMFMRDQALWLGRQREHDIADDDIPF